MRVLFEALHQSTDEFQVTSPYQPTSFFSVLTRAVLLPGRGWAVPGQRPFLFTAVCGTDGAYLYTVACGTDSAYGATRGC